MHCLFELSLTGVEYREETEEGEPRWVPVCSRLEVIAATRDDNGEDWGQLLRITDEDGNVHDWAMPMTMLAGDGNPIASAYWIWGSGSPREPRRERACTITLRPANPRCARGASRASAGITVLTFCRIRQSGIPGSRLSFKSKATRKPHCGSLASWRIAARHWAPVRRNSRLVFAVSVAFAAPLLYPLDGEGGGFHFRGASSVGKTTALRLAAAFGAEGFKAIRNLACHAAVSRLSRECMRWPLVPRIIREVDGREAGRSPTCRDGEGKSRARKDGSGRRPARWRGCFSPPARFAGRQDREAGRLAHGGRKPLHRVSWRRGSGLGLFETFHELEAATRFRGVCGPLCAALWNPCPGFLERLVASNNGLMASLGMRRGAVETACPKGADGRVRRVAQRFGMVAVAGWLASRLGVVPWPETEAFDAARACFAASMDGRGGCAAAEEMTAIRRVPRFIEEQARAGLRDGTVWTRTTRPSEGKASGGRTKGAIIFSSSRKCSRARLWRSRRALRRARAARQ